MFFPLGHALSVDKDFISETPNKFSGLTISRINKNKILTILEGGSESREWHLSGWPLRTTTSCSF